MEQKLYSCPSMFRAIKDFLKRYLPKRFCYVFQSANDRRFWWLAGVPAVRQKRDRVVNYDLQDGCFLETFWIDRPDGAAGWDKGPSAILVVHGSEILKFDCYGNPTGHYHIAASLPLGIRNGLGSRLWFPEATAEQQVDRSIFELKRNLAQYLKRHPRAKVRNTRISKERLAAICGAMRTKMLEDWKQFGEVAGRES